MPLRRTTQFSTQIGQRMTCVDEDNAAFDLSDATGITGVIEDTSDGSTRAIAGGLSVDPDNSDVIVWDMDADDVATAGTFRVQLIATFPGGLIARSIPEQWVVLESLVVA